MQYELTEEVLLFQKRAGILTDQQFTKLTKAVQSITEYLQLENQSVAAPVDTLIKKVANTGADIKDEDVQLDILNSLIDANFQPEKVDPEQVTEYKKPLEEEGGGALGFSIDALEHAETIEKIANALHVPSTIVKEAVKWLKKILEWPFDLIKRIFFTIARAFGASIETAEKIGIGGLAAVGIVCLVYGIYHFPGLIASVTGSFGLLALGKLAWALIKSASGLKGLWDKWKAYKSEASKSVTDFSTNDFLTQIEPSYKEQTGKKIPSDWVFDLQHWQKEFPNKELWKGQVPRAMKDIADTITKGGNRGKNAIRVLAKLIDKYTPDNKAGDIFLDIIGIWIDKFS